MSELDEFLEKKGYSTYVAPTQVKATNPKGWEPGVVWGGTDGTITTKGLPGPISDWSDQLKEWGMDPNQFEIIEPVRFSTWESQTKEGIQQLWSYRAGLRAIRPDHLNVEVLVEFIKSSKAKKVGKVPTGDDGFVIDLADWQLGKRDGGGTKGVVERITKLKVDVIERIKELRKIGRPLGTLYVVGMGDIVENCDGFYAMQSYQVEYSLAQQEYLAQVLIADLLKAWALYFDRVIVVAVPGNHGENRKDGKAFTTFDDNSDTKVFRNVAMAFKENSAYDHVSFVIPADSLSVVLDIGGVSTTLFHGHQAKGGATPQRKTKNWMMEQAFGEQVEGLSRVFMSAHYHHLAVVQEGPKTWFQCPALEGSSDWFVKSHGTESPPGTLTVRMDSSLPTGWDDMAVLR